ERREIAGPFGADTQLDVAHSPRHEGLELLEMVRGRAFFEETDRRVDRHRCSDLTEQVRDGAPDGLTLHIPQRDVDCATCLRRDPLVAQPPTGPQTEAFGVAVDRAE